MTLKKALEDAIKKLQNMGGIEFGGEKRDITSKASSYLAFNLLGSNGQPKVVFKVEQKRGALYFTLIVAEAVWSNMESKTLDDIKRKYKVTPNNEKKEFLIETEEECSETTFEAISERIRKGLDDFYEGCNGSAILEVALSLNGKRGEKYNDRVSKIELNDTAVVAMNQSKHTKGNVTMKEEVQITQTLPVESDVTSLMQQIVECGLKAQSTDSECHVVWESQGCTCRNDFHVPEPWNGNIANAKLLFLSINPGYTANELYPRLGNKWWRDESGRWSVDRLNDFFINRFSSKDQYVRNEHGHRFSIRMEDGTYKPLKGRTFWGDIDKIASLILNGDVQIGGDYALTEIVHCKTKNQGGLRNKCYTKCMNSWLEKVLNVARNVEMIVVVGGEPRTRICRFVEPKINAPERYKWYERSRPDGKKLNWLFIDHPAAYQCKPVEKVEQMIKWGD